MVWRKAPAELVELFDRLLPEGPGIERRKMFGYPAAFTNGQLFAGLHQESLVLKLSEEDRRELRERHGATRFEPVPGRPMGAFVVVPPALLADATAIGPWLAKARAYVASLPAKTRPPKSRKRSAKALDEGS